ncbi:U3 small nucleolar ribonucleoprotein-like protein [Hapsidospora chrysogenum ATCC 11550]|uniref:U3 small nucleolar ribonucleoprotein protein MPP10 n=1 Tax=Hapsidospora chrysogenum (strain ATCC 11550 / CBS 779.69 / DSM 880 / IAM 14645 / JCM 23072 / IMI 49137) TaxID=857340 RepID=A0A086TBW1_HAPC1|nr:U3 small nucleolar ribonucleoprotein-like protein [Hapsidospora chrysogenum ATCC 11550]
MAADTASTLTSTSHTLTALPTMPSSAMNGDGGRLAAALFDSLEPANRHAFIQPGAALPTESLNLVRDVLEDFAGQVADEQQQRLKESRKRKRGGADKTEVLKIRKVYVDGFETDQVWQQAKRIIGGVLKHADVTLEELQDSDQIAVNGLSGDHEKHPAEEEEEEEEEEEDTDNEALAVSPGQEDEDEDEEGLELDGNDLIDDEALEDWDEHEDDFEDAEEDLGDQDDYEDEDEDDEDDGPEQEYEEDPDGLNDGFFSLDEFNRQSQWFEEQDARGDPNTDRADDDDEIDWTADPLAPTTGAGSKASGQKSKKPRDDASIPDGTAEDEEDEEDDGPTFGNMALDAPEGDSEDEAMQDGLDGSLEDGAHDFNANEVYYKDFFAPPKKKKSDSRGGKPRKNVRFETKQPDEADIERAMDDVRRDLFDDESDMSGSDGEALSDVSAGDPKSRRSAHERRQAKLAEEIRKLEAASVAKREWTLSGEAAAADRPVNSLLEQDLDFEHVGKPVPVITPEVSEGIEDLIKRRILAQEFDEVIRRRPGTESVPAGTRRGMVLEEVDDTKGKSLAEVYEEEHAKRTNPDTYVSQSDEKLQREEREIENMWRDVSARLDALSSWHYRPRPVEPTLSVVSDVATVAMEDAQPTTAQGISGGSSSRMAPQEVYSAGGPGTATEKGEVVPRNGLPVAKQEMSREEKQRLRRREKERVRKAGGVGAGKTLSSRAKMQRDTVADLKKGGVKVINRKGEVTDIEGKKVKAAKTASSGSYKL